VQSTTHLLQGGSVFEAGAGGTAPRLVPQLLEANHLRWDSVGELVAFAGALEHAEARDLARALQRAVTRLLENDRAPSREVGELDTRGQHFYVALYWAQELEPRLASLAERLGELETSVVDELRAVQGEPVDIGGYYRPDPEKIAAAMRPSRAFNEALESVEGKR